MYDCCYLSHSLLKSVLGLGPENSSLSREPTLNIKTDGKERGRNFSCNRKSDFMILEFLTHLSRRIHNPLKRWVEQSSCLKNCSCLWNTVILSSRYFPKHITYIFSKILTTQHQFLSLSVSLSVCLPLFLLSFPPSPTSFPFCLDFPPAILLGEGTVKLLSPVPWCLS